MSQGTCPCDSFVTAGKVFSKHGFYRTETVFCNPFYENVWSNDDSVDNIVMEYWNDPVLAQLNELEKQFYTQIQHDDALDDTSEHAVQNKVVTAALNTKADKSSFGVTGETLNINV